MSFIKIPLHLKFKKLSKKSSGLLSKVTNMEHLPSSSHFLGGIRATSKGLLTLRQLNSFILILRRVIGRGRASWPRVHLTFGLRVFKTEKSSGHRMGHGKGKPTTWSHIVVPGTIFVKLLCESKKYVFLDNFSWTLIYIYLNWQSDHQFIDFAYGKSRKKRYTQFYMKATSHRLSPFTLIISDAISDLRAVKIFHRMYSIVTIHSICLLFHRFIGKLLLLIRGFLNGRKFSRLRVQNTASRNLASVCIFFCFFFTYPKQFYSSRVLRTIISFKRISQLDAKSLFYYYNYKFWFVGLIYNFILKFISFRNFSKKIQLYNKFSIQFNRNLLHFFRFLHLFLLHPISQTNEEADSFDCFRLKSYFSRYLFSFHVRRKHRFIYKSRKTTLLPYIFRGLRRVQYKLPFTSDIIFPSASVGSYLIKKRSLLKHFSYKTR